MKSFLITIICFSVLSETFLADAKFSGSIRDGSLLQELEDVRCFVMTDLFIHAEFVGLLTGEEIFTVFSPQDGAFDQVLISSLTSDTDLLSNFLNYHMIPGNITSGIIQNDETFVTREGTTVLTNIYETTMTVNGASIMSADQWAENGMIHVINKVLYPAPAGNILSVLFNDAEGRFTTLLNAIEVSGLGGTLAGGPLTLFAPTNEAFEALPGGILDNLFSDPKLLEEVLLGHIVSSSIFEAGIVNGDLLSEAGKFIVVVVNEDGITVDGGNVIETDLIATNGAIHAIDTVIHT
ncbi:transforming growth factor-beta-induced protein ig-h3-like [Artemia franciscana]